MNKYELSVLIPARNEMFLKETVENLLQNIRANTEIIVALDGEWADPGLPDARNLTIIYFPKSIGQRAATNQACRLSSAKYVMKIDAHCVVDEGFDTKMLADIQEDWTMIPTLYNLHGFDWVCIGENKRSGNKFEKKEWFESRKGCGYRMYQSPTPQHCPSCKTGNMERELVFQPRMNRRSTHYRFDKDMHFQYWGSLGDRPESRGDISETLSAQGSCFMLSRKKYWELTICDEAHGSWGQQGTEIACKTWLSGGRLVTTRKTWYSHLFRTQGGDFGFPYPLSGSAQEKAKEYSKDLWLNDKWPLAKYKLEWLLQKFSPVPVWHDNIDHNRNIIFYTDNQLSIRIAKTVQRQLKKVGLPIVSASLKNMNHFGKNIHLPLQRGIETYFKQIIAALEASEAEIVYFCEHDVLYHPSHFTFIPERKDLFYYNQNFWRVRPEVDNFAVHWDANQVSGLVCYRELALQWYKQKLQELQRNGFDRSFEPGGRDTRFYKTWKSEYPNIDIRHTGTLTKDKWSPNDFRDKSTCVNWQEGTIEKIPGWNLTKENFFTSL